METTVETVKRTQGTERAVRVVVAGLVLGLVLLALDAVYLALLLVGPPATGVLVARRRADAGWAVGPWVVSGLFHLVLDAVVNQEDVAFHAVVTVFTALLAWGAWALARPRRARAE